MTTDQRAPVRGTETRSEQVPFLDLRPVTRAVETEVLRRWLDVLDTCGFIGGEPVTAFEEGFAALCGTREAVGTANGTDALHLAFRALGIGAGDEVIVPSNTFVATVEAIVLAGARPRFVDVDPDTLLLTAAQVEAAVTPRTRAVVAVHLYGQMPDMGAITETAERLGLVLVEDAAQAHGATWQGRPAGSFGAVGCFSFYPGKNLGAFGDGGAVVTSDAAVADRVRAMRDHGRVGGHHEHGLLGTNSRLDALQAVVLSAKLPWLAGWNEQRRRLASTYRRLLDPERATWVPQLPGSNGVHHHAVVRVAARDEMRERLAGAGVGTGVHYPTPCHLMAPYASYATDRFPVAEQAAREVMSLPMYPGMVEAQAARVAAAVNASASARTGAA